MTISNNKASLPVAYNDNTASVCSPSASGRSDTILAAEAFVRSELQAGKLDSSHDWWHVHRVRNMALRLAQEEGLEGLQVRVCRESSEGWGLGLARVPQWHMANRQPPFMFLSGCV